jgi:YVTN family beta-propeller protein
MKAPINSHQSCWKHALVAVFCSASLASATSMRSAARPAIEPSSGILLVANSNETLHRNGEGYITLVDPASGEILKKIPDGGITAHEVVASKDGRLAFAPIYGNGVVGGPGTDGSIVSVLDLVAGKVAGTIDFGHGVRPHFAVWGPDGLIYVTIELEQAVSIIDPQTLKVVGSIPTGQINSHNVIVSHDGRRAYTSNVYPGTVSVLDVKARKLITVISVAPPEPDLKTAIAQKRWGVQRIGISPDDKTVLTCAWSKSEVIAIDTATNTVRATVPVASGCYGAVVTPDGKWALAPMAPARQMAVIDTKTMKLVRNVDLPAMPQEILVRPDGGEVYISCRAEDPKDKESVAFVRTADWTVERTVATGYFPDGLSWSVLDPASVLRRQN